MDAIIIADAGNESVSATNKLKLILDGYTANVQLVKNFTQNQGVVVQPIIGDGISSWGSSLKLNGIYLYSYLTGQGFDVQLIDSYFLEKDKFIQMIEQSPKAIVISTTFIVGKRELNHLVQDIRDVAPGIFIIAGGQFVHLSNRIRERQGSDNPILNSFKQEYIFLDDQEDPAVDLYIISPRGEEILAEALTMLVNEGKVRDLPNTATYKGKRYLFNRKVDDIRPLEGVTVDWARMPREFFQSGVIPVQASYGCPYNCAFCNFMKDRRLMGVKPIDALMEELRIVQEKGARYIWFVDDNFRLGRKDLEEVCQKFIDQGIKVRWKSFIRPSALEYIDMGLLKEAGCIEVQLGIETADRALLKAMNKEATPELFAMIVENVMRTGINCSCYLIFGFPGETEKSVRRTYDFIKSIEHQDLDGYIYFTIFPFIIAPLSPISDLKTAQRYGLKGNMFQWEHNTMNSKEAREYAFQAFFELESSGIIYHEDNLDMLLGVIPQNRKKFIAARHALAKKMAKGHLRQEDPLRVFSELSMNSM